MACRRPSPVPAWHLLVLLWIACSALLPPASLGYELTASDVAKAVDAIKTLAETADGDSAIAERPYKLFVAGFIRLAFHSCVGDKCVGCLNVNDPSNNGLNASVAALERVRATLGFNITRGDLWALAASVAFRVGVMRSGGASDAEANAVRFRYGRQDCATAPYTSALEAFPDKRWGIDDALKYFGERGFSAREFAALMGFHTLGVVRDGPSRVVGQWVDTPDRINNQFYQDLATKNWTQRATIFNATGQEDTVYTWGKIGDSSKIMINTDVAVLRNFSVADNDAGTGRSGCSVMSACPESMTSGYAEQFAGNVTLWRLEGAQALTKLIERGYSELKEPTPDSAPTTPSGAVSAAPWSALALLCASAVAALASK